MNDPSTDAGKKLLADLEIDDMTDSERSVLVNATDLLVAIHRIEDEAELSGSEATLRELRQMVEAQDIVPHAAGISRAAVLAAIDRYLP